KKRTSSTETLKPKVFQAASPQKEGSKTVGKPQPCQSKTVYFNCAPNFQVSLHDPTILNTLVLNVHLPEVKFQNERHEFNPRCLLQDDKGETTILAMHSKDTPSS
ncbi:unnamed protein product, partial [Arabidopsis halleri]